MKKLLIIGFLSSVILPLFTPHLVHTQEAPIPTVTNKWSQLSFPVESFQAYTSGFGWRWNHTEFHPGLDIAAPYGSYIHNWLVGRAVSIAQNRRCGTHVVIQSRGWKAIYCHMASIQISEGQIIPTGAVIGRVGMTGRTTGPHLHFQLEHNGKLVNPALVLKAMYLAEHGQTVATKSVDSSETRHLTVPLSPQ